jgi:hypothetical protein
MQTSSNWRAVARVRYAELETAAEAARSTALVLQEQVRDLGPRVRAERAKLDAMEADVRESERIAPTEPAVIRLRERFERAAEAFEALAQQQQAAIRRHAEASAQFQVIGRRRDEAERIMNAIGIETTI